MGLGQNHGWQNHWGKQKGADRIMDVRIILGRGGEFGFGLSILLINSLRVRLKRSPFTSHLLL